MNLAKLEVARDRAGGAVMVAVVSGTSGIGTARLLNHIMKSFCSAGAGIAELHGPWIVR